jgi:hypothetical protein
MSEMKFKTAWAWPSHVDEYMRQNLRSPSLHVFNGSSRLGDVKIDLHTNATIRADALHLPIRDNSFQTVFGDPPWNIPKHLRSRIMYELRRVLRVSGELILNANWYPNNLHGCTKRQPILVSRPRMPFGNAAFILHYTKTEEYPVVNQELPLGVSDQV